MKKLLFLLVVIFVSFSIISCEKQQDPYSKVLDPDIMVDVNPNLGLIPYNTYYMICKYYVVNQNQYAYNDDKDRSQTIFTVDISVRNYQMFDSLYYGVDQNNYKYLKSTERFSVTLNQKLNPTSRSLPIMIWGKRIKDTTGTLGSQLVQIVPEMIFFSQNGANKKVAPASRDRLTISFMVTN